MTRKQRLRLLALATAIVAVASVRIGVERYTCEPPNYSQVEDGLWLGGYVSEPPPDTRAVLNLCETEDAYQTESHRWVPIRDAEPAPSLVWLREQVTFIETERAAGRTAFVHCRNGVSRSAMVLAAYLMKREGWSRDAALEHLRSRRPIVRPNPAFMTLLAEWEKAAK
jgi:protein-tyrosine phosphatase